MPLFLPSLLWATCALTFSFFTRASTLSLANETHILREDFRYPLCFPPPAPPRIQPLSKSECERALMVFMTNLPLGPTTILTHDPDKAHLPQYILAPAIAMYGECWFGADIPPGQDAPIDAQSLIYQAHRIVMACVGKAEYDGGRSRVEVPGTQTWIDIDFQYWVPLANATQDGVGNITGNFELVLNSPTAAALPALPAISDSAMVERRWAG